MVIYNNKKVLFFRRISFSGWIDYTNNWFDGAKYFNCNDIYNLFDNNIDIYKKPRGGIPGSYGVYISL